MEPAKADREYPLGEIIIKTGKESQEHMADKEQMSFTERFRIRVIPMSCAGKLPINI